MASSESLTVDPLVPLTLLETVREADRPEGESEAEYVPELLNKRLGTSDTVLTKIRRYGEAAQRGQRVARDEVGALFRLVGRRPDAALLFETAGEAMARAAYGRTSRFVRGLLRVLPRFLARPIARRKARVIEARYFAPAPTRDLGAPLTGAYHAAGMREVSRLFSLS